MPKFSFYPDCDDEHCGGCWGALGSDMSLLRASVRNLSFTNHPDHLKLKQKKQISTKYKKKFFTKQSLNF